MTVLEVSDVGKKFRTFRGQRPWTLQEAVMSGFRHLGSDGERWSVRHVSFALSSGQALGVIGRNGAGKSTLLRLAGGVLRPDEGSVAAHGRVGGLLELTAGFHPDLTGRENAEISGVLRGLTRRQVLSRFDAIVNFSELEDSIDRPLRTYSSGMQMRLAFAVAVHCEPDVLLVDEVLAVGDSAFQNKCLERIRLLRKKGCAIVLVSHDASLVEQMCDEALWMKNGMVNDSGPVEQVIASYKKSLHSLTAERTPVTAAPRITSQGVVLHMGRNRFGSQEIEITDVRLCTGSDPAGLELRDGDWLSVELDYSVNAPVDIPIFLVTLIHDDGRTCVSANTEERPPRVQSDSQTGHVAVRWAQLGVEPGTYFVEIGAYRSDWSYAYDYHVRAYPLVVRNSSAATAASGASHSGSGARAEWLFHQPESH